jgi:hypothetical protein
VQLTWQKELGHIVKHATASSQLGLWEGTDRDSNDISKIALQEQHSSISV